MGGAGRCSAAVCDRLSRPAAWAPRDPAMVRAGAVGTHLPTSSLDIFGDLRKMNKRQVTEARVGGRARFSGTRCGCSSWGFPGEARSSKGSSVWLRVSQRPWVQIFPDPRVGKCLHSCIN